MQSLFVIIVVVLAGYGIFTEDSRLKPFISLFLGLAMLVVGIQEFKGNKKLSGWVFIGLFAFSIFAAIRSFMLNY